MTEKAVPEEGIPHRVPGPVGLFIIEKDDARFLITLVRGAPDVPVAVFVVFRVRWIAGGLEPGMLVGGVIGNQVGDDAQAASMSLGYQRPQVVHGAVVSVNLVKIGHVVAVVAQG